MNKILGQTYKQLMHENVSLGYMSISPSPGVYFIPYHPEFTESMVPNEIRIVFDASATVSNKLSLNQCLHTVPNYKHYRHSFAISGTPVHIYY